jgi:hypothetical protein
MTDSNESEKSEKPNQKPSDVQVGIPIMVRIMVPVSVPLPKVVYENPVFELNGDRVVDVEGNEEHFQMAMGIAAKSPLVEGAVTALLSSAGLFKHNHPGAGIRVFYTPVAGVIDEEEI